MLAPIKAGAKIAGDLHPLSAPIEAITGTEATDTRKLSFWERTWAGVQSSLPFMPMIGAMAKAPKIILASEVAGVASKIMAKLGNLQCEECAKALIRKLKAGGVGGELIELNVVNMQRGFIISDTFGSEAISTNGRPLGVLVNRTVYDNIHKTGIAYDLWIKDFHAMQGIAIKSRTPF